SLRRRSTHERYNRPRFGGLLLLRHPERRERASQEDGRVERGRVEPRARVVACAQADALMVRACRSGGTYPERLKRTDQPLEKLDRAIGVGIGGEDGKLARAQTSDGVRVPRRGPQGATERFREGGAVLVGGEGQAGKRARRAVHVGSPLGRAT